MKKTTFLLTLFWSCIVFSIHAQVYPIPQKMSRLGIPFFLKKGPLQLSENINTDSPAFALINRSLGNSDIKVIIGEASDPRFKKYTQVPKNAEGYYLSISPKEIVLIGRTERGSYYGAQTLSQLVKKSQGHTSLQSTEIIDFPDIAFRGSMESFYGNSWSHQDRIRQLKFYGQYKLNTYIYAPRKDIYHGLSTRWRQPYPLQREKEIKELLQVARDHHVNFTWTLRPGLGFKWTDSDGDGIIDDYLSCLNKLELMYKLGVRSFAIFFDDIGGESTKAEKQVKLLNYLNRQFIQKKSDLTALLICPSQYNKAWSKGDYLDILGARLDQNINILWTGDSLCSDLSQSSQAWINKRLKRKAFMWWNWPANDYCRNKLLLGRAYGLDKKNKGAYAGFVSKPMNKPESSKIALFSVADYSWNINTFQSKKSWSEGIKRLTPSLAKEMQVFAHHNSDPGQSHHAYRREESVTIKASIDRALQQIQQNNQISSETAEVLKKEFRLIQSSAKKLQSELPKVKPALFKEIQTWLEAFDALGQAGFDAVTLRSTKLSLQKRLMLTNKINHSLREVVGKRHKANNRVDIWTGTSKNATGLVSPFIKKIHHKMTSQIYSELTGKEPKPFTGYYKIIGNFDKLNTVTAKRDGKYVRAKPSLTELQLRPKEYIGLELPLGIFANYLHLKLGNTQVADLGEVQVSIDGLTWQKQDTQNRGGEMHHALNIAHKIRYMRYLNTSGQNIKIKLNTFKLDIPEDSKPSPYLSLFDNSLQNLFKASSSMEIHQKEVKKATQVFIFGETNGVLVVYKTGEAVPYSQQKKDHSIKSLIIPKNTSIEEVIWQ